MLVGPDMWHHGEVSYVGSEVSFRTSNTVYNPLLLRQKNPLSTQVKFDESVFPLERFNQTIDSHEFATMHPFAKTKKDRKYQSLFQMAVFPLAICPEV